MSVDKKPFHETVAENLIEQLKAGTAPWQKPWEPGFHGFMPMNPKTGKRYKGINAIHLMAQGYEDNRWMTYNQAKAAGAQVRKGEKGTSIQYWKFSEEHNTFDDKGKPVLDELGTPMKETVMLERPRVFCATVFNAEQIDGMPPLEHKENTQIWNPIERAEHILKASEADIRHGEHDRAFYRFATDSIHLPDKKQFSNADSYYATALHELGHWTGHSSRLDRDMVHPFGSEGYAKEELKAECFSLIMGDALGIGHDPEQHAAYVGSWIKALQNDPLEIFRATSEAEKMSNYVLAFEQKRVQEQDQTQEAGMQLPKNNQQMCDELLSELFPRDAQRVVQVANERLRLSAGETDAQAYEEIARQALGFDLSADWDGTFFVQGDVIIEREGKNFIEPARGMEQDADFWGVYVQNENGKRQRVVDVDSQDKGIKLANLLGLLYALSETNEHEKAARLYRVKEVRVLLDPNSRDDDISKATEYRKTAGMLAMLNDSDMQDRINEYERQQKTSDTQQIQQTQGELGKQERTYLKVPFREKDEAKGLGARWDRQQNAWFVPPGIDISPFSKWLQGTTQKTPVEARPYDQEQANTQITGYKKQYLAVPYGERGAAKAAGAKWDRSAKSWYIGSQGDMEQLSRWIPDKVKSQQGPAMSPREEFAEAMKFLGCVVNGDHPIMDGKKHRITVEDDKKGESAGFYVGHLDGHPAGYISNNRTGVDMKWKFKGYSLDPSEKAKLQAEAADKLATRVAELDRIQEATAERISTQMLSLVPVTQPTPYMQNKGIQPQPGVLTDAERKKTYIPAYDENGKLWSMQYIQEDGIKRFAKNSRKEGCFHIVGGDMKALKAAPALVLQEGYATAATNAEALGFATVATFDSGNLPKVAKVLHDKFPDKPVVILGDDDRHQELTQGTNPGKTKAQEAAKIVGGKAVFPVFAPGEAEYPAGLSLITPQSYRKHLQASKALKTVSKEHQEDLQKALLSKEQLAALNHMKNHTDFNDMATRSSLGYKGVERQVRATVEKVVRDVERKHEQKQVEKKNYKKTRSVCIG